MLEGLRRIRSQIKPLDIAINTAEQVGAVASRGIARGVVGEEARGRTTSEIAGGQVKRALAATGINITQAQAVELYHLTLGLSTLAGLPQGLAIAAGTLGVPLAIEQLTTGPAGPLPLVAPSAIGQVAQITARNGAVEIDGVSIPVRRPRKAPGTARAVRNGLFKRDARGRLLPLSPRDRKKCEDAGFFKKKDRRKRA